MDDYPNTLGWLDPEYDVQRVADFSELTDMDLISLNVYYGFELGRDSTPRAIGQMVRIMEHLRFELDWRKGKYNETLPGGFESALDAPDDTEPTH